MTCYRCPLCRLDWVPVWHSSDGLVLGYPPGTPQVTQVTLATHLHEWSCAATPERRRLDGRRGCGRTRRSVETTARHLGLGRDGR